MRRTGSSCVLWDDVRVHLGSGTRWCVFSSPPALVWGVHTMVPVDNCCHQGDWDPYMDNITDGLGHFTSN